ncbi:MAG: hypothetical protein ACREEP_17190, partial [Dongiaceae bacterium]
MKPGVVRLVAPRRADWAGQSRQAPDILARPGFILRCNNVIDAAVHVIALRGKGVHGAMRQARSIRATVAGMSAGHRRRQWQCHAKQNGGAIGVPQAVFRMNLNPERRCANTFGALGPALKGPVGRAG